MLWLSLGPGRACVAAVSVAALLGACGGGGGGNEGAGIGSASAASPANQTSGGLPAASSVANICTLEGEKQFTRSYLNENYLWYSEIPAVDATAYTSVRDYFKALLTPQRDSTGAFKDRFSFITPTADADALLTGNNVGYGVRWESDTQGRTRVAFVDADSPAATAALQRGGELVSTTSPQPNWFPNGPASITFVYRSTPAAATSTITLQSAPVREDPLPLTQTLASGGGRKVAYLLFNAHTLGAQDQLIAALSQAASAGLQDVVLDMRYNSGGYLYTARTLASILTGSGADNKVFEQLRYNDKRQALTDSSVLRFAGTLQTGETQFAAGTPLPRLALPRVYLLTTRHTCSASESVINSLRGVGVEVILIGQTTCGKPYGFTQRDNCGFSYFPIEFQGVNNVGFGDYSHGFAPTCAGTDDFEHPLGNTAERLLATALYHVDKGACPAPALSSPLSAGASSMSPASWPIRGKIVLRPR